MLIDVELIAEYIKQLKKCSLLACFISMLLLLVTNISMRYMLSFLAVTIPMMRKRLFEHMPLTGAPKKCQGQEAIAL